MKVLWLIVISKHEESVDCGHLAALWQTVERLDLHPDNSKDADSSNSV